MVLTNKKSLTYYKNLKFRSFVLAAIPAHCKCASFGIHWFESSNYDHFFGPVVCNNDACIGGRHFIAGRMSIQVCLISKPPLVRLQPLLPFGLTDGKTSP